MDTKRRPIHIETRVLIQNAKQLVGDSPVYALVELITNSDDSYSRIEKSDSKTSGLIHIEIVRKRIGSTFRVVDQAEGFDRQQMDEKIGRYGGETSGRESPTIVRGYYGRGLKEAMVGVGYGRVRSVKNGYLYECDVDDKAYYDSKSPVTVKATHKGRLGIYDCGTEVTLKTTREEIKTPQFERLKEQLQKYFSLRNILQDPNRIVQLIERSDKGDKKREPVQISYKTPRGKKIYQASFFINYKGQRIDATIEINRSELPLSGREEAGPYRENGLLISDGKAIHDITLFKYDSSPEAERLFGQVTCEYIYTLLNSGEEVISDKRDELNNKHPFIKSLKLAVEEILEPIIKEEKMRRKEEERDIETRETKERFKKLLKDLGEITKEELGDEVSDTGLDEDLHRQPEIPENGFAFLPPITTVVSGKIKSITLRALVPHTIPFNKEILIQSDSEELIVHTPKVQFQKSDVIGNVASETVKVEGRQVGALGLLTARFGELKAECLIEVRSKPKEPTDIVDGLPKNKGLFKDITYSPKEDPRYRVMLDRASGIITVATQAPSVKMYIGPYGENQNERYARVLIGELVTDVVCREIARKKVETGRTTYPQSNIPEAINFERAQLIDKYAHRIHKILAG